MVILKLARSLISLVLFGMVFQVLGPVNLIVNSRVNSRVLNKGGSS